MTTKTWYLRDELYRSAHRWPSLLTLFALGCLAGWLLSIFWPAKYRATSLVYVALNPYRTYSDSRFLALVNPKYSNIDNYNYWQMSQLESAIFLDEYLKATLDRLRSQDPHWDNITIDDLRWKFNADWRSAGTWSLIAEDSSKQYAEQAAKAWSEVSLQGVKQAVNEARSTVMIDNDIQAVETKLLDMRLRQQQLASAKSTLMAWSEIAGGLPAGQGLESTERWRVIAAATHLAQFTPAWMQILEQQPASDAPRHAYINWIEQIKPLVDDELLQLQSDIDQLEDERARLASQYYVKADSSLGLSPNLEIKELEHLPAKVIRPTSTFILAGGIIGVLAWLWMQLVWITRKAPQS